MFKKSLMALTALCTVGLSANVAQADDVLHKVFVDDSSHYLKFRYRLENIDQDGYAKNATASTLRSTLGYKTGNYHGLSAGVEVQNVALLGQETYNDSINGKKAYPTIADPALTAVTKAFLSYDGIPDTAISIGRQQFNFDNMRFVNHNNWRQHHQSFDSVALKNTSVDDLTLQYVYASKLNRSNGPDHPTGSVDTNFHLFNANYSGWKYGSFTAYSYLFDYDDSAFYGLSSRTFGARFTGEAPVSDGLMALYTAEYATQSDHGDNAANYDAGYYLAELGIGGCNWSVKLGYEVLEADGTNGVFTTPMGTAHGFHGWADKFTTIPATGLEDKHVKLAYKVKSDSEFLNGLKFDARYHQFDAEEGSADYGSEIDLKVSKKFMDHYSAALIYETYDADTFSSDTDKVLMILGAEF